MKSTHLANIGAIIPAAGQGKRMGGQGNKLLLELAGIPIILITLRIFEACPSIKEIVIPTAINNIQVIQKLVRDNNLRKVKSILKGGQERQDSVARALQVLAPEVQKVVVHDGARPLLALKDLNTFLKEADNLEAAVMGVALKDTIKKVNGQGWVEETPLRDGFRTIQTPQLFNRQLLEKVHKLASVQSYYTTDDASLMEWQGYPVKVLKGSYENIKVTTPEDLLLAAAILRKREGEEDYESRAGI